MIYCRTNDFSAGPGLKMSFQKIRWMHAKRSIALQYIESANGLDWLYPGYLRGVFLRNMNSP